jgi:flavin reductase (DIM6/NTAB) family NADH-FMN oxidoreductase RutF
VGQTGGVTIHTEHPFLPPEDDRDQLRRFRGRMAAPVTIWATGSGRSRAGWTVSSMLVADGEPPEVLGLIDEDSELWEELAENRTVAISLLGWPHRQLADAFAGTAPAPGGVFKLGSWTDTSWGPVLDDAVGWLGARLIDGESDHAGWTVLARGRIEEIRLTDAAETAPLVHLRGRYRDLS